MLLHEEFVLGLKSRERINKHKYYGSGYQPLLRGPQMSVYQVCPQRNEKKGCWVFRPAFGCCVHPKAGRNTQHKVKFSFFC